MSRFLLRFPSAALLVAALAMLALLPGLPGGFLLDDGVNILDNPALRVVHPGFEPLARAATSFRDANGARALPMLSFAIDHWRAGGFDAASFKQTGIAIHGLTAFFLAFFLHRLLLLARWPARRAAWGALLLALAWGAHPLQVSSVLYVVQRMQTMATLFVVLALWAYVAMRAAQFDGRSGRWQGALVVFAWLLALACKEDAVLLPAYTLALELTVLRFAAGQAAVARGLRQSYALMVALGLALFVFYALPHYWSWEAYGIRDFNTPERLLTQARVLVMYLGQILVPWPDSMPFFYDDYAASRGLWQPWTTLPALALLGGLLAWGLRWRHRRPLFGFGVLFFFAGHFLTSNIIGLELVFEHRNYLPLLGVLLALADLLVLAGERRPVSRRSAAAGAGVMLVLLGCATLARAHTWGDPVRLGERMAQLAPHAIRPWVEWSGAWFGRYKASGDKGDLQRAIEVGEQSFRFVDSYIVANNLVLYKSLQGTLGQEDWQRFYDNIRKNLPAWRRQQAMSILMGNVNSGFITDKEGAVRALMVLLETGPAHFDDVMTIGEFAYINDQLKPALMFFRLAAQFPDPDEFRFDELMRRLTGDGHQDWVDELKEIRQGRSR